MAGVTGSLKLTRAFWTGSPPRKYAAVKARQRVELHGDRFGRALGLVGAEFGEPVAHRIHGDAKSRGRNPHSGDAPGMRATRELFERAPADAGRQALRPLGAHREVLDGVAAAVGHANLHPARFGEA